jgi:hypothetical protein
MLLMINTFVALRLLVKLSGMFYFPPYVHALRQR